MKLKRNKTFYNIARTLTDSYICSKHKIEVLGYKNIPLEGPALIIPKHQTWKDILLEGYILKKYVNRPANWVMKSNLPKWFEKGGGIRITRVRDLLQIPKEKRRVSLEIAKKTTGDTIEYINWLYSQNEVVVLHAEGNRNLGAMNPINMSLINYAQKVNEVEKRNISLVLMGIDYENLDTNGSKVTVNIERLDWSTPDLGTVIGLELARLSKL